MAVVVKSLMEQLYGACKKQCHTTLQCGMTVTFFHLFFFLNNIATSLPRSVKDIKLSQKY